MYAHDTAWAAWRDSDMRSWLVYHRYLRSDAQKTRGELVKLMQEKYTNVASRTAKYLTWPNARLRPYLRENGISDDTLPTTRPRLLQELRIRWTQAKWRAGTLWRPVKDIFDSGVEVTKNKLLILAILAGGAEDANEGANEGAHNMNKNIGRRRSRSNCERAKVGRRKHPIVSI